MPRWVLTIFTWLHMDTWTLKQTTFQHWRGATHYCIGRMQLAIIYWWEIRHGIRSHWEETQLSPKKLMIVSRMWWKLRFKTRVFWWQQNVQWNTRSFWILLWGKKASTIGDEHETNTLKRSWLLALLTLQWQLIGRMDDMVHMKFCNLTPNIEFPFSI